MPDNRQLLLAAYDQYSDAIYRHCFFRLFSKERAEELMQETFLKTWQYLELGNKVDNLRALLYRIANNLIIDDVRRKKTESLEEKIEEGFAEPAGSDHKDLERQVLLREIRAEMETLPEDYQRVLVMRYIDDLEPREIAEILNTDANNVSVKIHRALMMIKTKFTHE